MRRVSRRAFALLLVTAMAVSGCRHESTPQPEGQSGLQAALLRPADNYWPAADQPGWFELDFGGLPQAAKATVKHKPGSRYASVELSRAGQALVEKYVVTGDGISFVGAGGDTFEPPIPLIEYGRLSHETRRWQGLNNTTGEPPLRAVARISVSEELTRLPVGTLSTVKVTVSVGLPERQTGQDMTFWFASGEGLVKASLNGYTRSARPALVHP